MYCSSDTCPYAWEDNVEQRCYDCEFMTEPIKTKTDEVEDCPGQLFFNFFSQKQS